MEMKVKQRKQSAKCEYYVNCNQCPKEIVGTSESQVIYNLNVHIKAKHRRKNGKQNK